jgi:hypothetical protein
MQPEKQFFKWGGGDVRVEGHRLPGFRVGDAQSVVVVGNAPMIGPEGFQRIEENRTTLK